MAHSCPLAEASCSRRLGSSIATAMSARRRSAEAARLRATACSCLKVLCAVLTQSWKPYSKTSGRGSIQSHASEDPPDPLHVTGLVRSGTHRRTRGVSQGMIATQPQ